MIMSKQTKHNYSAIMRLYNVYFSLCSKTDFIGMQDVYSLIKSIVLE